MNITLRDLQSSDKEHFFSWVKDKDVTRYSLSIFQNMKSNVEIAIWFDTLLSDNSTYNKAIIDSTNEKLIGYAGIANLSKINLSGEYFIFIGDKSYHSNGVGTLVTKEIVKIGFKELGLNRIMLTTSEKNIGAIKAYKKAKFKTEGIMKQAFYRNGNFHDKVVMAILREEWIDS